MFQEYPCTENLSLEKQPGMAIPWMFHHYPLVSRELFGAVERASNLSQHFPWGATRKATDIYRLSLPTT